MRELYVYYQVTSARAAAAHAAVRALHRSLRREIPGLETRLLVRDDEPERVGDGRSAIAEPATWMETYALPGCDAGVDERLQSLIETHAEKIAEWIEGQRHVEAFVAKPSACDMTD